MKIITTEITRIETTGTRLVDDPILDFTKYETRITVKGNHQLDITRPITITQD